MHRFIGAVLLTLALGGCRNYDYYDRVAGDDGLTPADQYARYGREEAQKVAIGRAYARAHQGDSPADYARQLEAAAKYARTMPDVVSVTGDALGHWLLVQFKSGWRVTINPIDDGKGPADTPNLPAAARR